MSRPATIPTFLHQGWLFILFLFTATIIAYLPVWHAGFFWDDGLLITDNSLIKDPHGWYRFWYSTTTSDYYPLTSSAFWVEWRLWGMNAAGYHVVNVFNHAIDAILLWRLLTRLEIPGAKLVAAIFALHPVNVEAVAWISELKDTLAMFFLLLTLLSYLKFDDTRLWRWYWISVGMFVLSLFSKSAVAPFPLVLLGIMWWRHGRVGWKDLMNSAPFFAAAGMLALLTIWYQDHNSIGNGITRTDGFWSRLAIAGRAVWFYLYEAVLPVHLIPVYPRWAIGVVNMVAFVPGLVLAGIFVICWWFRATWGKGPLFALGCFVVMLLPTLGFLNISFFAHSLVADHWQYFAIPAFIALVVAGITKVFARFPAGKIVFYGGLLLVLGVLTWRQAGLYRDSETIWRVTVAQNPQSSLAHYNLGYALIQKGSVDDAITQFQQALQIKPDYTSARNNLGNALLQQGKVDEAIALFQQALKIDPNDEMAHYNLGTAFLHKGVVDDAIAQFQVAVQIDPDDAAAQGNLGIALLQEGKVDEAIPHLQQAVKSDPANVDADNGLGSALLQQGKMDEAIVYFQQALKIDPANMVTRNNLGNVYLQKGAWDQAIAQYQQAVDLNSNSPVIHNNLGNAYLQKGALDQAIAQYQQAVDINPGYLKAHYSMGIAFIREGKTNDAIVHFQKVQALAQVAGRQDIVNQISAALKSLGAQPSAQ